MSSPYPPGVGDERTMLTAWLDAQRAAVHRKCAGVSESDARRTPLPSSPLMSMAAVVRHLRWVEYGWFETSFLGRPDQAPPEPARWQVGDVSLARLLAEYEEQCARSRAVVAEHELDELEAYAPPGLELVSLRWILVHLIEETARHLGHLDALRELADGGTGY